MRHVMLDELSRMFRPELLNRIDEVIVFHPLTRKEIVQIVDLMLESVAERLRERHIDLRATGAAKAMLGETGYDPAFGARPLRRVIQREVENPIASAMLRGQFAEGDVVLVDAEGEKVVLRLWVEAEAGVASGGAGDLTATV